MSWNYRIIRSAINGSLGIHEVYYGPGYINNGMGWTSDPSSPYGETLEELKTEFELMSRAFSQPILREVKEGDNLYLEEEGK